MPCLDNMFVPNPLLRHHVQPRCGESYQETQARSDNPVTSTSTTNSARGAANFSQCANSLPQRTTYSPKPICCTQNVEWKMACSRIFITKAGGVGRVAKANGLLHLLPPGPKNPLPRLPGKDCDSQAALAMKEAEENKVTRDLRQRLPEKGQNWLQPITWRGKVKSRTPKPGITLYTGRKRMFKGHKWERLQEHRKKKQAILMRDMKKRVYNFKMVSHSL